MTSMEEEKEEETEENADDDVRGRGGERRCTTSATVVVFTAGGFSLRTIPPDCECLLKKRRRTCARKQLPLPFVLLHVILRGSSCLSLHLSVLVACSSFRQQPLHVQNQRKSKKKKRERSLGRLLKSRFVRTEWRIIVTPESGARTRMGAIDSVDAHTYSFYTLSSLLSALLVVPFHT